MPLIWPCAVCMAFAFHLTIARSAPVLTSPSETSNAPPGSRSVSSSSHAIAPEVLAEERSPGVDRVRKLTTACLATSPDVVIIGGTYSPSNVNGGVLGAYTHAGVDANGIPYFQKDAKFLFRYPLESGGSVWLVGPTVGTYTAWWYVSSNVAFPTDIPVSSTTYGAIWNGESWDSVSTTTIGATCPLFCSSISLSGSYTGLNDVFFRRPWTFGGGYSAGYPYYSSTTSSSPNFIYYLPDIGEWVISATLGSSSANLRSTTGWPTTSSTWAIYSGSAWVTLAQEQASTSCLEATSPSHSWDFRGCVDGVATADAIGGTLMAVGFDGAACSESGMVFDGVNDYVNIDDWTWGGATSVEAYVKYDSFMAYSRVFDFGSGEYADNFVLGCYSTTAQGHFRAYVGSTMGTGAIDTASNLWSAGVWVHVVGTIEGANMNLYKNGVMLGDSRSDNTNTLATMMRTNHFIAKSNYASNGYFDGTIAYLRIWNGEAVSSTDAATMYSQRLNW